MTQVLNDNKAKHIAIIMDGNGRWAARRGLPRKMGHRQGVESVRRVIRAASDMNIDYLTLFGFSSENWQRPESEVNEIMNLLRYYLRSETAELHRNGARLRIIGDRESLAQDIVDLIENAEEITKYNKNVTVVIAINYGGRLDIAHAARRFLMDCKDADTVPDLYDVEMQFSQYLMTAGIPDPDILIRTSGELRVSNFLLWQCAYAELIFTETLWPDFGQKDLDAALEEYAMRERRFGRLKSSEGQS